MTTDLQFPGEISKAQMAQNIIESLRRRGISEDEIVAMAAEAGIQVSVAQVKAIPAWTAGEWMRK